MFAAEQEPLTAVTERVGEPTAGEALPDGWRERLELLDRVQKAAGLTLPALGRRMGVHETTVSQYRDRRRGSRMGVDFMMRWLSACGYELRVVPRG